MNKILVAYFSASGRTKELAKKLATVVNGDLYEIKPKIPYTKEDLDWNNKQSRSTLEMHNSTTRPEIIGKLDNMDDYDVVYVGFPVWWYIAPKIINTFLESYNLSDKIIVPYATSGGSDMGTTNAKLAPSCPGARLLDGKVFDPAISIDELAKWTKKQATNTIK